MSGVMKRMLLLLVMLLGVVPSVYGVERFPPPDFESGHELPVQEFSAVDGAWVAVIDVAVLVVALSVVTYLILKKRSRAGVVWATLFSLGYFGFYREGCVCSIGSIQNVTLALFDGGYALPWVVGAFFLVPIVFTLLFGRTFCAGVCPLGAIQDLVAVKSFAIPKWLEQSLGMLRYVYLAGAIVYAAVGSAFIICEYDPFVAFFRLGGTLPMVLLGVVMLLVGMFLFRPYCRFLCPYGVVLGWLSRVSQWHAKIDPDKCIQCRLCEDACPFNAIDYPDDGVSGGREMVRARKRVAVTVALLPVMVVAGVVLGRMAGPTMAKVDYTVELAGKVARIEAGAGDEVGAAGVPEVADDMTTAFYATGRPVGELYAEADEVERAFGVAAPIATGLLGLVFGLKLVQLNARPGREDYEIDRSKCVACARCFKYCPHDPKNLELLEEIERQNRLVPLTASAKGESA